MNYDLDNNGNKSALQLYTKFDEGNFFETFWAGSHYVTLSGVKVKRNYSVGKSKKIELSDGSTIERSNDIYMGMLIPGIRSETCPIDSSSTGTTNI